MPLKIIRNDITKMSVDAIVNAANTALKMGGGVCGAIFSAAGPEELQAQCNNIGKCNVGEAVITDGFNLPAPYIIHTVGPIWQGGDFDEAKLLYNCYINSLALALENKCKSIAFPLISTGIYGYPKDQAIHIAVSAIGEFLLNHDMTVYLVVYDKKSFTLSKKLFSAIEKYIDDNYIKEYHAYESYRTIKPYEMQQVNKIKEKRSLEDVISQMDETFSQMLLRLIDEKGMTDVETYKKANIDRKLFSKIRSKKDYNPSKVTAIAFSIALQLNSSDGRWRYSRNGQTPRTS
jgi:O-acetyl-ADP-ribose deacetylase (regulator of RNase III)